MTGTGVSTLSASRAHRSDPRWNSSFCTLWSSSASEGSSPPASAAPTLTASLITWGVVGLDSNNVNAGPNQFAEGARVCNNGSPAATNVTLGSATPGTPSAGSCGVRP